MTLTRRRFLTIAAACAALPGRAQSQTWQGRAFGADIAITLQGPQDQTRAALAKARRVIEETERLFSLYDPASALVGLNTTGTLLNPDVRFVDLMRSADDAFNRTRGLFDPTVQPLWTAMAQGQDPVTAIDSIGWQHVRFDAKQITLGAAQALTFNGIAQGYATDLVSETLINHGLTDVLVNIGEHRGSGGPWTLALEDPSHGVLAQRSLSNSAIATSSPAATPLGPHGHILHTSARPQWSTVAVEAASATVADSLSTAMVLATRDQIEAIKAQAEVTRVTLVDFDGNLSTL